MKHTPGPWSVYEADDGDWHVVAGDDGELEIAGFVDGGEANARLIAAAPDLLAIARAWLKLHSGKHTAEDLFNLAGRTHDVIEKAEVKS